MSAPVILVLIALKHRLTQLHRQVVLAIGFGAAGAYELWRLWFWDIFPPPAAPPPRYYATTIVPWSMAFATAGWFLAGTLKLKPGNLKL